MNLFMATPTVQKSHALSDAAYQRRICTLRVEGEMCSERKDVDTSGFRPPVDCGVQQGSSRCRRSSPSMRMFGLLSLLFWEFGILALSSFSARRTLAFACLPLKTGLCTSSVFSVLINSIFGTANVADEQRYDGRVREICSS